MSESTAGMGQSASGQSGGAIDAASLESDLFSPRPNGPAVAALLAGAAGVFVLGLNTFLAAAAEGVAEWFRFQNRVGPLSGKTTMAGVAWLVVWVLLAAVLWRRNVRVEWVWAIVIVLLVVGNLLMFPPIYERVEPG
jgi:drug/metabolite transporter (DMT)-like permease